MTAELPRRTDGVRLLSPTQGVARAKNRRNEVLTDLTDKVAVVTGAGSGIGAALVRACFECDMKVVAADVNEARVEAAVESLPGTERARAFVVDVADAE